MSYADYPQILQNIENFGGKTNIVEHFNINEPAKVDLDYSNENRIGIIAPNYINNPSIKTKSYKIQIHHPNYKKTCGDYTHYPVKTPIEIINPSSDSNLNIPSDKILLGFNIDDDITKLTNNDQIDITIKRMEGSEAAIKEDRYNLNRCPSSNSNIGSIVNTVLAVLFALIFLGLGIWKRKEILGFFLDDKTNKTVENGLVKQKNKTQSILINYSPK